MEVEEQNRNHAHEIKKAATEVYAELCLWEDSVYDIFEKAQTAMTSIELQRKILLEFANEDFKKCDLVRNPPFCRCGSLVFPPRKTPAPSGSNSAVGQAPDKENLKQQKVKKPAKKKSRKRASSSSDSAITCSDEKSSAALLKRSVSDPTIGCSQ